MSDPERCPHCGTTIHPPGPCATCLITAAMDPPEAPDLDGMQLGPYIIGRKLGQGGTGVVYRAVDTRPTSPRFGHTVALKILVANLDAPDQLVREAQLTAALEHEHIVPVYEVGNHEGIDYFTMKYVDGDPLATAASDAHSAAQLTRDIAKAVDFAHRHDILHRDLKPANVLVDGAGRPFVTDFGLATREGLASGAALAPGGTPRYMAPEVWRGEPGAASAAADVWGAGAILYELLAGHPPFLASSMDELRRQVIAEPPPELASAPADLAAVCLHCLKKEPTLRYATAGALADDLERFLAGEPVHANPLGRLELARRWCGRHPAAAALFVSAAITLVILTLWALDSARAQEQARREEVLATNVYAARAVAGTVLAQLDEYAGWVAKEAGDPRLSTEIARGDDEALRVLCDAMNARHGGAPSPIAWWFIIDAEGSIRAHVPLAQFNNEGIDFSFRDYFQGATALAAGAGRSVHVSRAIRATSDDHHKIVIASPIRGKDGAVAGVLAAEIATNRRLGDLELSDNRRIAVLTVRRDRDAAADPLPEEHILLVHDGVEHGDAVVVESEALRRLTQRRDAAGAAGYDQLRLPPPEWVEAEGDYKDPLAERDPHGAGGPWLAGIAPVGRTELAVIVQTRLDHATALDRTPLLVLAAWSVGGALLLFAGLFAALHTARRQVPKR